ncbi:hypothetical protein [Streptomyces griseochromogenes]|uniref:hypothetical protein n=1 Tax=Streptomyces griseochromogenes TaxID=68214 RepID=UPI00379EAEDB
MPELPDDAALEAYAATEPERLHDLALAAADRFQFAKLSRMLADQRSQEATDWAVRLAEDLGEVREPESWRRLVRQIAWQLVQRPSIVGLRPQFESRTPVSPDDPGTEFRACLLHELARLHGFNHPQDDDVYLSAASETD